MVTGLQRTTLHITNAYHETSGGIRTFYHAAMETANREGRPFRLVVPAAHSSVEDVGPFARIYRIAAPASPVLDSRYRVLLPHAYLAPWRTALRRILLAEQPSLVEITDKYTLPWLAGVVRKGWIRGLSRPVLVALSCERMDDNLAAYVTSSPYGRGFARWYMKHCYLPIFDCHLAASDYVADELRGVATGDQLGRIAVRPFGVEFARFQPERRSDPIRDRLLQGSSGARVPVLLFYAGRLSPEKNVALLLDMMEGLAGDPQHAYRLAVAGSGPLAAWLEKEAARRVPGCIQWLPHVTDRDALAELYASADVFVHPNPREPFGIAPLEAMASGCALVAPRAGGILTYASSENAWLAAPAGAEFAAAVRAVFSDPDDRARRVAQARSTAAAYDWPCVMRRVFEYYDDVRLRFSVSAGRDPAFVAK